MKIWQREWKDYYKILEVEQTATIEELKSSYRRLMNKYHPDSKFADEEKAIEINLAYDILSDPREREMYDLEYHKYKKNNKQFDSKNLEKEYTEAEIKLAKQLALKEKIDEELEKVNIIINARTEIIYSIYEEEINNAIFFNQVKEFILLSDNYLGTLYVLLEKAYELEMHKEIETLTQVIKHLKELVDNMPLSIEEAKKLIYIENKKEMIKNVVNECKNILLEFDQFFISLCNREISKVQYEELYEILLLKLKENLASLESVSKVALKHDIEIENKDDLFAKMHVYETKIDYDSAVLIGEKLLLKEWIGKSLDTWYEQKNKILKIIKIVKKYPQNHHSILLREYAEQSIKKSLDQFTIMQNSYEHILEGTNNEYYAKDLSVKATKMFIEATNIYEEATKIFEERGLKHFTYNDISILAEGALGSFDEYNALKVFSQASDIIAFLEKTTILCDEEFNEKYHDFENVLNDIIHTREMFLEFDLNTRVVIKILKKYNININEIGKLEKKLKKLGKIYSHIDKHISTYFAITVLMLVLSGIIGLSSTLAMFMDKTYIKLSLGDYILFYILFRVKNKIYNYDDEKFYELKSDIEFLKRYK